LFKQKDSSANARPYSYVENRDGETFIPLLLKHVSIENSSIYTDSMSVDVNSQIQTPSSKIQE